MFTQERGLIDGVLASNNVQRRPVRLAAGLEALPYGRSDPLEDDRSDSYGDEIHGRICKRPEAVVRCDADPRDIGDGVVIRLVLVED